MQFNGNPNQAKAFLHQLVAFVRLSKFPNEKSRVYYAVTLLTDSALDWAMTYASPEGFSSTDLPHFAAKLERFFCSQRPVQESMNQLLKFGQGQQSVHEYASEFIPLAAKAHAPHNLAQHLFPRGLNRKYQDLAVLAAGNVLGEPSTRNFVHHITTNLMTKDAISYQSPDASRSKPSSTTSPQQQGQTLKSASPPKEPRFVAPGPRTYPTAMDLDRGPGKLPPHELARRIRENLCKRCGEAGHYAAACPLSTRRRQQAAIIDQ
jgi:hypothetical protein